MVIAVVDSDHPGVVSPAVSLVTMQNGVPFFAAENVRVHPVADVPIVISPRISLEPETSVGLVPQDERVGVPEPKSAFPATCNKPVGDVVPMPSFPVSVRDIKGVPR